MAAQVEIAAGVATALTSPTAVAVADAGGEAAGVPPKPSRLLVEQAPRPTPVAAPSPTASSPSKKSNDGFTAIETIALGVGALLFGGVAYKVYPRFFQASAERYYRSAWDWLKKRVMFTAAWAAGGAVVCLAIVTR